MNPAKIFIHAATLYCDPTLTYHNWDHISNVRRAMFDLYGSMTVAEQLAVAFHDVVYVPGSAPGLNEQLSAIVLRRQYQYLFGVKTDEVLEHAVRIVEATVVKNHLDPLYSPPDMSTARVLDADLCAFAFEYDEFRQTQLDIVSEFTGEQATREGLAKCAEFLAQFLKKTFVYHTAEAREAWEAKARTNILTLIDETTR